jgi:hypothetical protein
MKFLLTYAKGENLLLKDTEVVKTEVYRFTEFSLKKMIELAQEIHKCDNIFRRSGLSKTWQSQFFWLVLASIKFEFVR